ncbi:MAG: 2-phospho-L-lactate guanylyltransferase [Nitriliruptoraceae bacterium]
MDHLTTLVPLREVGIGKTRLSAVLDRSERAALATAMLRDVATTLAAAGLDDVVVVAGGPASAAVAADLGLAVSLDPPEVVHLDAALAAATRRLPDDRAVLVVAADLPRLRPSDIRAVLDEDAEVVIGPTAAGGTGALLRRPHGAIPTAFGPRSASRHRELARAAGCRVATVDRDGIHHDVDTFTDLAALHEVELGAHTAEVLPRLLGRQRAG